MSSEYDRQMALFNAKIQKPDLIIKAVSVIKSKGKELGEDCYWFLTEDDQIIMVDMREEQDDEQLPTVD